MDYYELLQVHPRADQTAIEAAYNRLRAMYDPAKLEGAADELVQLARQKRDDLDHAYTVLSDPVRRAAYDSEQDALHGPATVEDDDDVDEDVADENEVLDYRPLPPARRTEREKTFDSHPLRASAAPRRARGRAATAPPANRAWIGPALVGVLLAAVLIGSWFLTGGFTPAAVSAPPTATPSPFDQFEADIAQYKALITQTPTDANALIAYGNLLYNSAEIVRENDPNSMLYQQRLPRWLEATEVYSQALAIQPDNITVRADLGVSSCNYGAATGDNTYIRNGIAEAKRAATQAPNDERVLYNLSRCLLSSTPPQTEEALTNLRKIVSIAPADSPFAAQAQQLIQQNGGQ